jgi:hypothetical protein
MLSALPSYPSALIGPDGAYRWVSPGWALTYSPGRGADTWVGRDHHEAFALDDHPDWLAAWTAAVGGASVMRAEMLHLPGFEAGEAALWMLLPTGSGCVLILVVGVAEVLRAVQHIAPREV